MFSIMDKVDNRDISGQMMTMPDVADALKVSEKTVSRMLQDGSLPGFKVANQWRFYREDFYRWIDEKRNEWGNRARAGLASMLSNEMDSVPLSRLTNENLIVTAIPSVPRDSILKILSEPLSAAGIVDDTDRLVSGLSAREDMMSTGVGGGIAIPHLRKPGDQPVDSPVMVVGICPKGADWGAFDKKPVQLFLLPLSGDEVVHLRMLAAIRRSLILDGIFDAIISAKTPQNVMREIMKIEILQQNVAV
jgi:PTS system nitrogen regulatory IIA component